MRQENIILRGARENNLKNVDLDLPKGMITVFTGVSGSGKSSLVFQTIAQEAGRQVNETFPKFVQHFLPKYGHPDMDGIENLSMAILVDQKRLGGNSRSTLGTVTDVNPLLRVLFSRFAQPQAGPANHYSFNDPNGMCMTCQGIGKRITLDPKKVIDPEKSLNEGAILLPGYTPGNWLWKTYAATGYFDPDKKLKDYSKAEYDKLMFHQPEKVKSSLMEGINTTYLGLVERYHRQVNRPDAEITEASQKKMAPFIMEAECEVCHGARLNEKILFSQIEGKNIADCTAMQLDELYDWVQKLERMGIGPLKQSLLNRLLDLIQIGLDYMSLDRETATLSGGESQRAKMVKHLTSSLTDMIYIFDEPSIGLHTRDVHRMNELLQKLRDKGNTVLVVEHDPAVIQIADHIVDMGPKAGRAGGEIVYQGSYEGLLEAGTITGAFLKKQIPFKEKPKQPGEFYETKKSNLHNLKGVQLRIPKGLFTAITGVAGSGKSSILNGVFAPAYPEAIVVDQSPVSGNLRSNPATYTGMMDPLRKLFAKENGVGAGLFSFNSEGACPVCNGRGSIETNLSFMDSVETLCEHCHGDRYNPDVLEYRLRDQSIVDVLKMTAEQALEFFEEKEIRNKLKNIVEVGLGYLSIGQSLDTLSGGESQRLKLAKELNKKGNIYILDEPTTGLHPSDIDNLLRIINALTAKGNTVIVIEHNLDIVKNADWVVDMGPDGGSRGGEILYEGPPIGLIDCEASVTGKYLR